MRVALRDGEESNRVGVVSMPRKRGSVRRRILVWTFKSQSGNPAMSPFWTFREERRLALTAIY